MTDPESTSSTAPRLRHDGTPAPLVLVIAADLADAHSPGQYITGLIALAFVLAHDAVVRKR